MVGVFSSKIVSNLKTGRIPRHDMIQRDRAPGDMMHDCIFDIKANNLEKLREATHKVAFPNSPDFGKHWTREQVSTLTANPQATERVINFLGQHSQAKVIKRSRDGDKITVRAPVSTWERMFSTEFYVFDRIGYNGQVDKSFVRALDYEIPSFLESHVNAVFNTVQMPPVSKPPSGRKSGLFTVEASGIPAPGLLEYGMVTPLLLNNFYNITSNNGGSKGSQSLYESLEQDYSPQNLNDFQINFGLTVENVALDINGYDQDSVCIEAPGNCTEANLDVQYIMAVAQSVPTIYYYDNSDDFLLTWADDLLAMAAPPLINSISYAEYEDVLDSAYINTFETSAMKLSLLGVTIFAASGDDGVAGWLARGNYSACGYFPMWPATSPYVTAVGGTQGPESGQPDVGCSSDTGGVITSGGGFSNVYPTPLWQYGPVLGDYFDEIALIEPVAGFNLTGRAYPDVSAMAYNYAILDGSEWILVSGTSASTPVTAGFFSLINSARIAAKMSPMGWINPSLYTDYPKYTADILFGENSCAAGRNISTLTCCKEGFTAVPGWDPVTGFGAINFPALMAEYGPSDDGGKSDGLSQEAVVGIAVGGGVVVAIAAGAAYFHYAGKSHSGSMNTPLLDPVETTKSPMV